MIQSLSSSISSRSDLVRERLNGVVDACERGANGEHDRTWMKGSNG